MIYNKVAGSVTDIYGRIATGCKCQGCDGIRQDNDGVSDGVKQGLATGYSVRIRIDSDGV